MSASILVVDDSQMVRLQVTLALAAAGFDVIEAADGVDALEKLESSPHARAILCDVNMPRMGGLEFLERVQANGSTVPVVMLTTEGQVEMMLRAKALGAKGWIVKPFRPELLVAAIKKLTSAV